MASLSASTLRGFEPFSALSDERLQELASFCRSEVLPAGTDPLAGSARTEQSSYLARGSVESVSPAGTRVRIAAGSAAARLPLAKGEPDVQLRALEQIEVVRIDDDLIDIMVTWNQIESIGQLELPRVARDEHKPEQATVDWSSFAEVFSVDALTSGVFRALPPAHIAELLKRFVPIEARRGDVVVREGGPGDFYYVVDAGRVRVTRFVGGVDMPLADLKAGDAFGEEALIAEGSRNATATMKTDGRLLRLSKHDFEELLKRPLLTEISFFEAGRRVARGAQWLDVRFPSEFQHDRIQGAVNIPLGELRHALTVLDTRSEYITYCQSGRRSAAAAFLLAQHGFRAAVLVGGLYGARESSQG